MGHALIMGRTTFDSIGRALPGRVSIVLTRRKESVELQPRVLVAGDWDEAQQLAASCGMDPSEVFVVGGAEVYRQAFERADKIYRTLVHAKVEGDTLLPDFDLSKWELSEEQFYEADERNEYSCTLQVWNRSHHG